MTFPGHADAEQGARARCGTDQRVPSISRVRMGQLAIDAVDMRRAIDSIERLVQSKQGGTVYTPNVDHVVMAERDPRFRAAYARASLSLVDGMPVLWASKLLGDPLPEKVSGSDLLLPLMGRAAERGFRVYLLGGAPGVAELAAQRLTERYPHLQIVGTDSPRVSIDQSAEERAPILQRIQAAAPDLVIVALGGHKQELFCDQSIDVLRPAVLVCVGAALAFVAGTERRAPRWISRLGFEWFYRLVHDPRRLATRYLLRDPEFFWILMRQLSGGRRQAVPAQSSPPAP